MLYGNRIFFDGLIGVLIGLWLFLETFLNKDRWTNTNIVLARIGTVVFIFGGLVLIAYSIFVK